MKAKLLLTYVLLLILAACNLPAGEAAISPAGGGSAGPRAWVDAPIEGSRFPLGESINIRWHASAVGGIQQVEVRINAQVFVLAQDFDHTAQLVTQQYEWTPDSPGEYLIQAIATGMDGAISPPAENRIIVGEVTPTPIALAPTITQTPMPPTDTLAPPTNTLLPPIDTPLPPPDTPAPPTDTSLPSPTPDTQGPPAPVIVMPAGNPILPCPPNVKLVWNAPSDPSGIASYRVELQVKTTDWNTQKLWDPVTTTQVTATSEVTCGGVYRWRVRATDGAGNVGQFSEWAEFRINLP
ncbi:MAG: Ig-like domain-containing protein [Chloroflexota bacterium]